ncbi:MAG: helix-turn-helix domain-containing protein [Clostridia bacterium]|nr:helix-turn-helix domain-containing protein [Clostridia bacterium]
MVDLDVKLRELRRERQWTQGYVAKKIGVSASVISAYELGLRQPSFEVLAKLSRLYGVSSDYLLGISGHKNIENQHLISLDGLTPEEIKLVIKLVDALKA